MGFDRITKAHLVQVVMAAWIVFSAWNTHMAVMAAPLPQSATGGSSYPANDSSLNDPFSTPDYLGNKIKLLCKKKIGLLRLTIFFFF